MKTVHETKLVDEMMDKIKGDIGDKKVPLLKGKNVTEIFKEVPPDNDLRAFIDAGAFFEGRSNEHVASELLEFFGDKGKFPNQEIKGVLFFEGDRLTLMKQTGITVEIIPLNGSDPKDIAAHGLANNELFTYYDQSHTTGIDIAQKSKASAMLFIGSLTLERDLRQAAGRMRGRRKGKESSPS